MERLFTLFYRITFTGELMMKITKETLKSLIKEVMDSSETEVLQEATFNTFLEKINDQKLAFFIASASRGERGRKYSRRNISAANDLEAFLKNQGLSFQKIDGGYTEKIKKMDPETNEPIKNAAGEEEYEIDLETGEPKQFFAEEVSYLVFGNAPHYGDEANAIKDTMQLFELAKQACLVDKKNPQDAFSFGYPVKDSLTGEDSMFIALYKPTAPAPGPKHMYTAWGGPWYSVESFGAAEGAYTAVRKGKSTFVEERLAEAKRIIPTSINEGMAKKAEIEYWTKILNRARGVK